MFYILVFMLQILTLHDHLLHIPHPAVVEACSFVDYKVPNASEQVIILRFFLVKMVCVVDTRTLTD
jgi:hypothetical protein